MNIITKRSYEKEGKYSALSVEDFDFANKLIYVGKQFTRGTLLDRNKTRESTRIVHMSEKMIEIVKWHLETFNIKQGFLFEDMTGKPVSAKWVSRKLKKLLKLNGFPDDYCRVHDLRGQYVDIMHYCGIPTEYISKEVGHSNTATTSNIYTQILNEVPIEANQRMDKKLFDYKSFLLFKQFVISYKIYKIFLFCYHCCYHSFIFYKSYDNFYNFHWT